MAPTPLTLCPGGYHRLADEAGNHAAAGLLALARLAETRSMAEEGALLVAIYDALRWAESLHERLYPCPQPCQRCEAGREANRLRGG